MSFLTSPLPPTSFTSDIFFLLLPPLLGLFLLYFISSILEIGFSSVLHFIFIYLYLSYLPFSFTWYYFPVPSVHHPIISSFTPSFSSSFASPQSVRPHVCLYPLSPHQHFLLPSASNTCIFYTLASSILTLPSFAFSCFTFLSLVY